MICKGPSNSLVCRFPLDEKREGTGNSQQWEERVQHTHQRCSPVAAWDHSPTHRLRLVLATLPKPLTSDNRVTWGPHAQKRALMDEFSGSSPRGACSLKRHLFASHHFSSFHFVLAPWTAGKCQEDQGTSWKNRPLGGRIWELGWAWESFTGSQEILVQEQLCHRLLCAPDSPFSSPGPGMSPEQQGVRCQDLRVRCVVPGE